MTAVSSRRSPPCSTGAVAGVEREARWSATSSGRPPRRRLELVGTRRACAMVPASVSAVTRRAGRHDRHRPADTRAPPHRRPAPAPLPVPHRCPDVHEHLGTIDVFDLGTAPASSLTAPTPTPATLALLIGAEQPAPSTSSAPSWNEELMGRKILFVTTDQAALRHAVVV